MSIKVVTICGSMKFAKEMQVIATNLETQYGYAVIQCVDILRNEITSEQMQKVVDAHFKKIDISDSIYVVNINGYIGESTKREIEYATKHGKQIIYHEKI